MQRLHPRRHAPPPAPPCRGSRAAQHPCIARNASTRRRDSAPVVRCLQGHSAGSTAQPRRPAGASAPPDAHGCTPCMSTRPGQHRCIDGDAPTHRRHLALTTPPRRHGVTPRRTSRPAHLHLHGEQVAHAGSVLCPCRPVRAPLLRTVCIDALRGKSTCRARRLYSPCGVCRGAGLLPNGCGQRSAWQR